MERVEIDEITHSHAMTTLTAERHELLTLRASAASWEQLARTQATELADAKEIITRLEEENKELVCENQRQYDELAEASDSEADNTES